MGDINMELAGCEVSKPESPPSLTVLKIKTANTSPVCINTYIYIYLYIHIWIILYTHTWPLENPVNVPKPTSLCWFGSFQPPENYSLESSFQYMTKNPKMQQRHGTFPQTLLFSARLFRSGLDTGTCCSMCGDNGAFQAPSAKKRDSPIQWLRPR